MKSFRATFLYAVVIAALHVGLAGCGPHEQKIPHPLSVSALSMSSSSLMEVVMSSKFTCDGADIAPELSWKSPPAGTQSFVLIMTDRDSWFVPIVHWLVYDMPADKREMLEGTPQREQLSDGLRQGTNDFDKVGYAGPCPHWKSIHHYNFVLYALDSKLNLPSGATAKQALDVMKGHILAQAELTSSYRRK